MSSQIPPYGSIISIISQANVRYEGCLVRIDLDQLQLALCQVRFFGTEDREADVFMGAQSSIYPYVMFNIGELREFRIIAVPSEFVPLPSAGNYTLNVPTVSDFAELQIKNAESSLNGSIDGATERSFDLANQSSMTPRSICDRSVQTGRSSSYWCSRLIIDYVNRSGDPNLLPIASSENMKFEHDYDFEKYNRLFVELLSEVDDYSLNGKSITSNSLDSEEGSSSAEVVNSPKSDDVVTTNAFTPRSFPSFRQQTIATSTPERSPTAYDKSKSFFDTISCSSLCKASNRNQNWREWNKETFGIPMVRHRPTTRCHQRLSMESWHSSFDSNPNDRTISTITDVSGIEEQIAAEEAAAARMEAKFQKLNLNTTEAPKLIVDNNNESEN